ncbi:hypothetical protein D3C77_753060 [compost metagenome]
MYRKQDKKLLQRQGKIHMCLFGYLDLAFLVRNWLQNLVYPTHLRRILHHVC